MRLQLEKKDPPKGVEFLPHTLIFNLHIFANQCRRTQIFQTMNSIRSNNVRLKYQWITSSGCKAICLDNLKMI